MLFSIENRLASAWSNSTASSSATICERCSSVSISSYLTINYICMDKESTAGMTAVTTFSQRVYFVALADLDTRSGFINLPSLYFPDDEPCQFEEGTLHFRILFSIDFEPLQAVFLCEFPAFSSRHLSLALEVIFIAY